MTKTRVTYTKNDGTRREHVSVEVDSEVLDRTVRVKALTGEKVEVSQRDAIKARYPNAMFEDLA